MAAARSSYTSVHT